VLQAVTRGETRARQTNNFCLFPFAFCLFPAGNVRRQKNEEVGLAGQYRRVKTPSRRYADPPTHFPRHAAEKKALYIVLN
jgi:hypothetical protein